LWQIVWPVDANLSFCSDCRAFSFKQTFFDLLPLAEAPSEFS